MWTSVTGEGRVTGPQVRSEPEDPSPAVIGEDWVPPVPEGPQSSSQRVDDPSLTPVCGRTTKD